MPEANIHAQSTPSMEVTGRSGTRGEGPYMFVSLQVEGKQVIRADFETYGCPYAIACGNWLTGWVKGKTLTQAGVITAHDLSVMLGGLPLGKEHCAQIAVKALQDALRLVEANERGGSVA